MLFLLYINSVQQIISSLFVLGVRERYQCTKETKIPFLVEIIHENHAKIILFFCHCAFYQLKETKNIIIIM